MTEAEIGVMTSTSQGTPTIANNYQKLRKMHGIVSSSEPSEETKAADTLISDSWPPEL